MLKFIVFHNNDYYFSDTELESFQGPYNSIAEAEEELNKLPHQRIHKDTLGKLPSSQYKVIKIIRNY